MCLNCECQLKDEDFSMIDEIRKGLSVIVLKAEYGVPISYIGKKGIVVSIRETVTYGAIPKVQFGNGARYEFYPKHIKVCGRILNL